MGQNRNDMEYQDQIGAIPTFDCYLDVLEGLKEVALISNLVLYQNPPF